MALPLFKERRMTSRKRLTGLLPGGLRRQDTNEVLGAKPVDVSKHGLGLLIAEDMAPGSILLLQVRDQEISLEVSWKQPDFGKQDLFRYGVVATNPNDDLEEIFARCGCLLES